MAGDMVISCAAATAKMMVQFLAFEAAQKLGWMQIATSAATEQSALSKMVLGLESAQLAAHTATESGKTGVTATQTAARTGLQGAESASFLGRLGAQIAGWLGLEIGKTAETGAGAIARSAIQDTETTTAVAAAKTEAAGTIPALTAQAAMGAAAAVAPTPVDGPELALAAAASMNSLGASQLSLASAYGGWAQVPEDGMLAELHRNEMVLPASIANPLRSVAEGGGLGNSGGTTNATFNVSAIDGASVQAFFNNHAALIAKTLGRAQARNPSIGRGS
jgi:hypothetical protein